MLPSNQPTTAVSQTTFDANGYASKITQDGTGDTRFNRAFVNDAQGRTLYVNQGAGAGEASGRILNGVSGYEGGHIGDAINPGHVQRQLIVNGEVLARYGDAPNNDEPVAQGQVAKYTNTAEFNFSAPPLQLRNTSTDAMSYTVVGGETLQGIARSLLGDGNLWYRLAEANGLAVAGDTALKAGQTLVIPKLALNANNVGTFQPYDPSKAMGDTNAVLPALPTPGADCGGMGQIIMIVVAVAVAVTVMTGGAALAAMGYASVGAAASAGAIGSLVAEGAIGGAAGSIVSQGVGIAIGAQDSFSWKSVGLSALGGGISAGLGGYAASSGGLLAEIGQVGRAIIGNVVSQGVGVVTGLQSSFNWKSVAASAAGAAVGQAVGDALAAANNGAAAFNGLGEFGGQVARGTVAGFAAGTAAALMRGGRISVQQVATDAFGQAIGQSLASSTSGINNPSGRDYVNEMDRASDMAYAARQQVDMVRTPGDFARMDGANYRSEPYNPAVNDTFSGYAARQRANDPILMAMYDRSQAARLQDLVYRPQDDAGTEMTLAIAAATSRRSLFSNASNAAFRDTIARIDDPAEIALMQFDRLRQAGVVSSTQYADMLNANDQSREAYGRVIWGVMNARTFGAIVDADPLVRNGKINADTLHDSRRTLMRTGWAWRR